MLPNALECARWTKGSRGLVREQEASAQTEYRHLWRTSALQVTFGKYLPYADSVTSSSSWKCFGGDPLQ